jgi:hypothetical protein
VYWVLISAVLAALTGYCVFKFWNGIRDRVKSWLGSLGLGKTLVTKALVQVDRVATMVRARLLVEARTPQKVHDNTEYLTLEEVDDPEVHAVVARGDLYQRDIMSLID